MYKEFFGLDEAPFNLTPDPRFLYMSERHREALASLVYGIREHKGFICLSGAIGAGKTTLCRAFLKDLDEEATNVALVLNSFLTDVELLQTINEELGLPAKTASRKDLIGSLNKYLIEQNEQGRTTIVIIDEAQNLSAQTLEQVRMLSNLETESSKLIQIVLIGQPELNEILASPDLEQLNQRVMVRAHISPLDRDEIYHYVRHRLHVAGAKINISLTPPALNRLYHFSGGVPRKINLLMDRALLAAYVSGRFQLDPAIIAQAAREVEPLIAKRKGAGGRPGTGGGSIWAYLVIALLLVAVAALSAILWTQARNAPAPVSAQQVAVDDNTAALPPQTPGLDSLPSLAERIVDEEWVYDEDGMVRVSDRDFARTAALLTCARLWRRPVFDIAIFRTYEKTTLVALNMERIFRKPLVDLQSFRATGSPLALIKLDLPMVLSIDDPAFRLSPAVVLLRVEDGIATLGDPRLGVVRVGIEHLQGVVKDATVVYYDPINLASIRPGVSGEAVDALHAFLVAGGYWQQGEPGVTFDGQSAHALGRFQKSTGLPATGEMNGPTAARMAADMLTYHPRLDWVGAGE